MHSLPGVGLITLDTDLRVCSWNDWLVTATGIQETVAQGRLVTEFVPVPKAELIAEELSEVLRTGGTRVLAPAFHHFLVLCPPLEPNPYFREMRQRVTIAPLRDESRVVGVLITLEDVTGRIVEERALAEARGGVAGSTDVVAQTGADDWRARAAATRTLTESATEAEVAQLLEALQRDHDNFSVLSGALQVLVAIHRDVTPPLIGLLRHPNANLRMHAALALGALGDGAAVGDLLRTLDDRDTNVRFHAIEALGRLAAGDAVDGLRRIAESEDFFLAFPAIDALARIDDPGVAPALVGLIDRDDLRPAVIDALAALGDEDCVAALVRLLNDGRGEVATVASALTRIAQRYDDTFGAAGFIIDAVRRSLSDDGVARLSTAVDDRLEPLRPVITVLGWVGSRGLRALTAALSNIVVREALTEAILGIGAPAVPALVEQLRHGSRDARIAAAFLIGAIGSPDAAPALVEVLGSHDNELVTTAARALAALGDASALEGLIALFAHPDVMVRQAAVSAVSSLGASATEARVCALIEAPDPLVRECAIRAGGYFGFGACVDGILKCVHDDIEEVRRAAIEQLPLLEDGRAVGLLRSALDKETPRNRAAAAHALRLVDDPVVDDGLIEGLGDEDAWVRYFAAGSLEHRRTPRAAATLEAMAMVDAAPHVRIAAITALGAIDPEALARVAPVAIDDVDDDIAAAMVCALSNVPASLAQPLLETALRSGRDALLVAAVDALGSLGTFNAIQSLAWAARLSAPAHLAETAANSLRRIAGERGDEVGAAALAALLELGVAGSRREEVVQLLSGLPVGVVPMLVQQFSSPRPAIRTVIVEALARMRHASATTHVAIALQDPDASVRAAAVMAFGRLGSSGVAQTLLAMSERDPDPSVRRRARAVCRRYGWSDAAVPHLRER